jgi:hypothetical protein
MRSDFSLFLEKGDVFRVNLGPLGSNPMIVIERPKTPILTQIGFWRSSNVAPTVNEVAVAEAFAIAASQVAREMRREYDEHVKWAARARARVSDDIAVNARTGGQDGT